MFKLNSVAAALVLMAGCGFDLPALAPGDNGLTKDPSTAAEGVTLAGKILGQTVAGNIPIAGAEVTIFEIDGVATDRQTTAGDGVFRFDWTRADRVYLVTVQASGWAASSLEVYVSNAPTQVTIVLTASETEVAPTPGPDVKTFTVAGTLLNLDSEPVSGAVVAVQTPDLGGSYYDIGSDTTDVDGNYAIVDAQALAAAPVRIHIQKGNTIVVVENVAVDAGVNLGVELQLENHAPQIDCGANLEWAGMGEDFYLLETLEAPLLTSVFDLDGDTIAVDWRLVGPGQLAVAGDNVTFVPPAWSPDLADITLEAYADDGSERRTCSVRVFIVQEAS